MRAANPPGFHKILLLAFLVGLSLEAWAGDGSGEAPPASADVAKKAGEIIERMEIRNVRTVWDLVPELESLGEAAMGRIEEGLESGNPAVRLACAKALYYLGLGDAGPLEEFIEKGREPEASMAAGILGMYGEDEEAEFLSKALEIPLPPSARIAVAQALGTIRREDGRARSLLKDLLNSADPSTVENAALALAELGESEPAMGVLGTIKHEPSLRGRLARSLLRRLVLEKALSEQSRPRGNPVKEVMDLVKRNFLEETGFWDGKRRAMDDVFLRDAAAVGMARSLDPFSGYMTEEQYKKDRTRARGKYAGIGAFVVMREYLEDGKEPPPPWEEGEQVITVDRPIYAPPAPAFKKGIRSGDQIVAFFDEEKKEWVSIIGWPLQRCVDKLKGPVGTVVRIRVKRQGRKDRLEMAIERQTITVNVALAKMLPGDIGYILLKRFDNKSSADFERALMRLKAKKLKGLVLDLRGNPGGTMREVVAIIDRFLEPGLLITYTRGMVEDWTQDYYSRKKPHPDFPMAVLIRKDSASGSEMLAGALKAHKRAVIVGETSFGKGSGQTLIALESANRKRWLRLTIFKYYLKDHISIHERGVTPDILQKPDRLESWQYDWQLHLTRAGLLQDYVNKGYPRHQALFFRLSEFDGFSCDAYPEFEGLFRRAVQILYEVRTRWTRAPSFPSFAEFFARHDTREDRDFIRLLLRGAIRRRVQDDRQKPFIQDFQETVQLQRAIFEVLKKMGTSPSEIPHYKHFAHRFR